MGLYKSRLDELGLIAVTVDVGPNVTLLPRAVAGDKTPLSESEIALAPGPLRVFLQIQVAGPVKTQHDIL